MLNPLVRKDCIQLMGFLPSKIRTANWTNEFPFMLAFLQVAERSEELIVRENKLKPKDPEFAPWPGQPLEKIWQYIPN